MRFWKGIVIKETGRLLFFFFFFFFFGFFTGREKSRGREQENEK